MPKYEFHEAANIFPLMNGKPFAELKEGIKTHGLQVPIDLLDGKIIDGRNRYRACEELGIDYTVAEVDLEGMDPVDYVISLNLHRRHLDESQRGVVAAKAKGLYAKAAKERLKTSTGGANPRPVADRPQAGKSRDEVGEAFSVGGRTVGRAERMLKTATPELEQAVEDGLVKLTVAEKLAQLPEQEQRAIIAAGPGAARKAAKEIDTKPEPEPEVGAKSLGVGVRHANEAIDCLKQIPKNDALRKRGFQIVSDWIRSNK